MSIESVEVKHKQQPYSGWLVTETWNVYRKIGVAIDHRTFNDVKIIIFKNVHFLLVYEKSVLGPKRPTYQTQVWGSVMYARGPIK